METIISLLLSLGFIKTSATPVFIPTVFPTYSVPTISYQPTETIQPTQTQQPTLPIIEAESFPYTPTPDWMQWIGTPVPDALTPQGPTGFVIDLDEFQDFDIDDAWDIVATPGRLPPGSLPACPSPLPIPFVDQPMAVEASLLDTENSETIELPAYEIARIMSRGGGYFPDQGNVIKPEDGLLAQLWGYAAQGEMVICQNESGVAVYGRGVQSFLDNLAANYLR